MDNGDGTVRATGIDPGEHRVFADASRVAVLATLRRSPTPLTVQDIAQRVRLHANTVRGHLAILTERGYVTSTTEKRARPGRPRLLYSAAKDESTELRNYRLLAETLVTYFAEAEIDHAAAAIDAGQGYGRRMARANRPDEQVDTDTAIRTVSALLEQAGFQPQRSADGIDLHRCPFRELAESTPDIVCGIHLGMMRGVLAELDAPVEAVRLRPFAKPDRCIAELRPRGEAA